MQGVRVRDTQNRPKFLHPHEIIVTRTLAYFTPKCQSCTGRIRGFAGVEVFWVFVKIGERGYDSGNWIDVDGV